MANIQIDPNLWTQEEKNLIKAAVIALLYENTVTHSGVFVNLPNIIIDNPSGDISFLTAITIKTKIDSILAELAIANAEAEAEMLAKNQEIQNSELLNIKLIQIDTKIDNINTLAELKIFLKKLARYIVARGI